MEKNNNMFQFEGEDIFSSSSPKKHEYEDIVSDSRYKTKTGRYKKKKRSKFGRWWGRRKLWQKTAMISALSIFLVFAIAFGVLRIMFDYNYNSITQKPEDLGFENVIDNKIINIALFGIDSRKIDSFKGLSDSIMIMSLNTKTKTVKLVSVMRDSLVPITYNGKTRYAKINSAYNKGGPELAIKTLNTIFGLDISEYATVNFYGMADIIDAVGGIDVTLTKKELNIYGYENGRRVNWGLNGLISEQCGYLKLDPTKYYIQKEGTHHLNGVQAVAYARIRKAANADGTNNDHGRTDRQRYVMEQLFNKALTLKKSQYMPLVKSLIPCTETSLSYTEIMSLAVSILLDSPKFEQSRVPLEKYQMGSKTVSGSGSCVYYDLDYAKKLLHAFFYDDITPEDYMEKNGVEKNDWYANRGSSGSSSSNKKPSSSSSKPSGSSGAQSNSVTSSKEEYVSEITSSSEATSSETVSDVNNDTSSESGGTESSGGDEENNTSSGSDTTVSSEGAGGNTGNTASTSSAESKPDEGTEGNAPKNKGKVKKG